MRTVTTGTVIAQVIALGCRTAFLLRFVVLRDRSQRALSQRATMVELTLSLSVRMIGVTGGCGFVVLLRSPRLVDLSY